MRQERQTHGLHVKMPASAEKWQRKSWKVSEDSETSLLTLGTCVYHMTQGTANEQEYVTVIQESRVTGFPSSGGRDAD